MNGILVFILASFLLILSLTSPAAALYPASATLSHFTNEIHANLRLRPQRIQSLSLYPGLLHHQVSNETRDVITDSLPPNGSFPPRFWE